MPNHITNSVTFKGPKDKIDWLKEDFKEEDGEKVFDFNHIVPMPEDLKGSRSPALILEDLTKKQLGDSWYKDAAISQEESDRRRKEYGADNWYDWSVKNWGTKWNAYDLEVYAMEDEKIAVCFLTAWSPPFEIFDEIEEKGIIVSGLWKDECDYEVHEIGENEDWGTTTIIDYYG